MWAGAFWLAGAAWLLYWMVFSRNYWEDDAYIHLDYARSVFSGHGFAFNGVPSNGDTSPVWVLLLALSKFSGLDWIPSGKALAVLGTLFFVWAGYRFSCRLAADLRDASRSFSAAAMFVLVLNPFFSFWAFSGMEAVTAAGWLMVLSLLLVPVQVTKGGFLLACAVTGIAPLLRPEMSLLALISVFFLFRQWRVLLAQGGSVWGVTLLAGFLLAAPVGAWVIYSFAEFGYALPNTNAAKRASPDTWVLGRMVSVYALGFPMVLLGLLLVPVGLIKARLRPQQAVTPGADEGHWWIPQVAWPVLIWFGVTAVFYVVNRTFVQTRYVLVVAPAVMIILMHLMRVNWGARLGAGFVGVTGVIAAVTSLWMMHPVMRNKCIHDEQMAQLASYIDKHIDKQDAVAIYSIGLLAYVLDNPIVDVGGITQPEAAKYLFGPQDDMVRWARSQGARYYVIGNKPEADAELLFESQVPLGGWSFSKADQSRTEPLRLWKLAPRS